MSPCPFPTIITITLWHLDGVNGIINAVNKETRKEFDKRMRAILRIELNEKK